ncbi:acyl-CoA/acyl-ACP dehydrogenase [Guyparkeria hydrothermalis]|uniref:acyl-CoA dehydrogenase family protein n=1 Tax=Guyparkeria hydrothermalis TaxID=923 RepID=UPI0020211F5E|nr:acyl-CoA dehydrogenase family protein [Guyparkeria hydrothermalis]MCL7743610.1 acyl-CoA/acyl-ACP dehydrogenase [Guyparkeria hydrothermalis]
MTLVTPNDVASPHSPSTPPIPAFLREATAPDLDTVIRRALKPQVIAIDHGEYPADVLHELGAAGAYRHHVASQNPDGMDIAAAIDAMDRISAECMSTGFMTWCQDAVAWYVENSDNHYLRETVLPKLASGELLGGTALSNPMKYFAGIEDILLHAEETEDGFIVNGNLPWISNLGESHVFGSIFRVEGDNPRDVMALIHTDMPGLELKQLVEFCGMEGTGTYALFFDNAFIPKRDVIADPVGPFLNRIKAGFVLLQAGMATGVIEGCIRLCEDVEPRLGHVNCYLDDRPEELREALEDARALVRELADDVHNPDPAYFRQVLELRLAGSELALRAANSAMLHTGANGYLADAPAQRKLREAYFVAIVTPAIKHLRKEIESLID